MVRMSEEFRDKAAALMAMLAVRSEGFYGRDMQHFFSAVQVRERQNEAIRLFAKRWQGLLCRAGWREVYVSRSRIKGVRPCCSRLAMPLS